MSETLATHRCPSCGWVGEGDARCPDCGYGLVDYQVEYVGDRDLPAADGG